MRSGTRCGAHAIIVAALAGMSCAPAFAQDWATQESPYAVAKFKPRLAAVLRAVGKGYELTDAPAARFILGQDTAQSRTPGDRGVQFTACKNTIVWGLHDADDDKAALVVGICDRQSEMTASMIAAAEATQRKTITEVSQFAAPDASVWKPYEPVTLALGKGKVNARYFAPIIASHGIFFFPALFIAPERAQRTVVLQLSKTDCNARLKSPLCTDPVTLLTRLGAAVVDN